MPITPPPAPITRMGLFKGFMGIFLPLCLVLVVVGSMHYYTFYTTERSAREASESLNVDLAKRMVVSDIASIAGDLMFLAEHIKGQGLLDATSAEDRQRIAQEFSVFAAKKGLYDQIRFLDSNGMEVVRVNYNSGKTKSVPEGDLQNKASRYYFREAMAQVEGGIYLSPLDLNIEGGQIEYPLKPMIRFGTPVFDSHGGKRGIILLNYFGERMIDDFTRSAANIADHIELVNSDGYWLSNPQEENEWGFMFGKETRFQKLSPYAWQVITRQQSGQFQTNDGMFTFTTIHPLQAALEATNSKGWLTTNEAETHGYWKIVSRISPQQLSATPTFFVQNHFALYLSMFVLILLGAWFVAHSQFRHRVAETQRDYEQRFRHTLENMDLAAVALNRQGVVTFCNDYFLEKTGWSRSEVIGEAWLGKFAPNELKHEIADTIERMGSPEQFPSRYENQVMTRDGSLRLIAWNNTLSYDAEGNVIGVTGIGEDITTKRESEIELLKLYQAVEQSPSTVLITDTHGNIEYVNPKFTEVSGYSFEEVKGHNPKLLKSGETSTEEYNNLWAAVRAGQEWRGEFHNRKKNGELYWESAAISAIRNPQGEITHFLAVKEDITEQKRLQDEVVARNLELARSQTLAAMGRMASMIAHDLRNPLSSVKMTLQILGKAPAIAANQEINELRQISLEQIQYMGDILSDMLTFSRPDALKSDWITIDKVIDMAASISQRRLDESNAMLNINYQAGLPTLYGDATKLRQVFSNLISNAAQATEGVLDPRIDIDAMLELGAEGTAIRVEIRDNGSGVNPDEMEKLFEPFFTTRAKGTGLGLAIVKRILDQHLAGITLEASKPQGACVIVTLPVTPHKTENTEFQKMENATS
ncbi:MAG: PAS domain S-box protein [Pseudomonadota bacterium]